jgi:hypothetical protein
VAGDHNVRGHIRVQAAHRSQPAVELTVISFYPVVRIPLDVLPRPGRPVRRW